MLQVCVYVLYTVPSERCVASDAQATLDAHTHVLTSVVQQAVCDEPLEQLHSTCALCIIYIYIALGNGDAAMPSKFS